MRGGGHVHKNSVKALKLVRKFVQQKRCLRLFINKMVMRKSNAHSEFTILESSANNGKGKKLVVCNHWQNVDDGECDTNAQTFERRMRNIIQRAYHRQLTLL